MPASPFTVTIREKGTGRRVRVAIRPDMMPDEVANEVKRQLGTEEPLAFYLRRPDGTERPIPTPDPSLIKDIVESGAEIIAERRRVYGSRFQKHLEELIRRYPFHYNQILDGYVLEMYSTVDKKKYKVVLFKSDRDYPNEPPKVYIIPYPEYVNHNDKYEKNHARSCCFPRESEAGKYCFLHIDPGKWRETTKEPNPLLWIMENIVQGLDLLPLVYY